jgi:tripartite-type tricarboxylate transporter receptor subunit TctC
MIRRVVVAAVIALATPMAAAFPDKPVRFVVGFTPGGPSDILARALGQKLAERWKQQVVVENRPGAGGEERARRPHLAARQQQHPRHQPEPLPLAAL